MAKNNVKGSCEECGKFQKRLRRAKGKLVCYLCWVKNTSILELIGYEGNRKSLDEVLNKIYEPSVSFRSDGSPRGAHLWLPLVMIGKKFKIVLVEEKIK